MTLSSRLRIPLTSAVVAALVGGLLSWVPIAAEAAPRPERDRGKAAAVAEARRDGLTRSEARFPRKSYLCYGYKACADAGMSASGYAANNKKMYWRMYAGHNCTNYAAYRMVRSGMPNVRPWTGGGNATYWGTSMSQITDSRATVGAIAWWKANQGPAGSAGHVAYVEQVVSADEIVVSQDSWRGDFSWARITRSSGNWPTGFIHFNDSPLVNTAAPVVEGLPKVGAQLSATKGSWNPTNATVRYQWFANGKAIPKATTRRLALGAERLGQSIAVRTTARRTGYTKVAVTSAATAAVLPGQLTSATPPVLSGVVKVARKLTLAEGTWNVAPDSTSIQWYADGQPIPGATRRTFKLKADQANRVITVGVSAQRVGYDPVTVSTAGTAPVTPGTIRVREKPKVSGPAKPGKRLSVAVGAYGPSGTATAVQWLRDGQPIAGATGTSYRLTKADLGTRVSAQVSITKAGYTTVALTTPKTTRVRATPRIKFERTRLRHGVKVKLLVVSRQVSPVQGTLLVSIDGGKPQQLTLRRGAARLVLRDLRAGDHEVKVVYAGGPTTARTSRTGIVKIR